MKAMFRSLASFNYRLWFIGALVSNIGAWMQATTQNWVVLTELTDNDAVAVGVTMALQFAPQLVLVPITGLIADRFDRRKILLVTQSSLMVLALGLGILLVTGVAELWHLYAFALALGLVNAVDAPARQTFVSDLVAEHNMANAVALNSASFNVARLIGPAVGGALIVLVGSGWVFLINAVSFIAMLAALSLLRRNELHRMPRAAKRKGQLAEGFRYVVGRPDLVIVFVIVFIMGAVGLNFPIFAATMAVEFGRGPGEYGLLTSILAIGSLAGALLSARRDRARLRIIIGAAGFYGVAALAASVMPTFWTFAATTILLGFGAVTLLTTANGYVQTTTDAVLRGRVLALYMAVLMGGTPLGAPVIGWVANEWGPRWALGGAGIATGIACLIGIGWMIVARDLRVRRTPESRWRIGLTIGGIPAADAVTRNIPIPPITSPAAIVSQNMPLRAETEDFPDDVALTSPIALPARRTTDTDPGGRRHAPRGSRDEPPDHAS